MIQHETASLAMFDHLVDVNGLKPLMKHYGLQLPQDLDFVKEMIAGPLDTNAAQGKKVPASVELCEISQYHYSVAYI